MYRAATESVFQAGHALLLHGGGREERHEHGWRVRAVVTREELDGEGLVVDFRLLRRRLDQAVSSLKGAAELGELSEFAGGNASAEAVARLIYDRVAGTLGPDVRLAEVRVWEEQGCWASYQADARP